MEAMNLLTVVRSSSSTSSPMGGDIVSSRIAYNIQRAVS